MGALLALFAAGCWAIGLTLFRVPLLRRPATEVNLFKCAFATVLLWITAAIAFATGATVAIEIRTLILMVISGIVGMSIGDTLLFQSMARLGATRALMLQSTNPLLATLFGWLILGEGATSIELLGIAFCSSGTLLVISDRRGVEVLPSRSVAFGIVAGIGAAAGQAGGLLLLREALRGATATNASGLALPFTAAAIRITAGALALLLPSLLRQPRATLGMLVSKSAWREMGFASLIGTYLGILAMTIALDLTTTGIVSALTSTTPLFLLGIGVVCLRERYALLSYVGVALGVLGAILLVS